MIKRELSLKEAKKIVEYYNNNRWNYVPNEYYKAINVLEHERDIIRMKYYKRKKWDYMSNSAFYTDKELEKELRELNSLLISKRR